MTKASQAYLLGIAMMAFGFLLGFIWAYLSYGVAG